MIASCACRPAGSGRRIEAAQVQPLDLLQDSVRQCPGAAIDILAKLLQGGCPVKGSQLGAIALAPHQSFWRRNFKSGEA